MDMTHLRKELSAGYSRYLAELSIKETISPLYDERVLGILSFLAELPINICVSTILGSLSRYIQYMRTKEPAGSPLGDLLMKPDPLLTNFEWALDSTVKLRKHPRLQSFDGPHEEPGLSDSIVEAATQLKFDQAVDFLGVLAGAWILSYPLEAIRRYDDVLIPLDWAQTEEDYIFVLRRHFQVEVEEWRR